MANIVHKTTKQSLGSVSLQERPDETVTYDGTDDWAINPDLSAVQGVASFYWKYEPSNNSFVEMNSTEKAAVDTARLPALKAKKIEEIDAKTSQIQDVYGFEFPPGSGQRFSLGSEARDMLNGIIIAKDFATYPIAWNFKDQSGVFNIPDATTVVQFYMTAVGTFKAVQDSGTALKSAVRAATTKAELDAVVDPR